MELRKKINWWRESQSCVQSNQQYFNEVSPNYTSRQTNKQTSVKTNYCFCTFLWWDLALLQRDVGTVYLRQRSSNNNCSQRPKYQGQILLWKTHCTPFNCHFLTLKALQLIHLIPYQTPHALHHFLLSPLPAHNHAAHLKGAPLLAATTAAGTVWLAFQKPNPPPHLLQHL